MLYLQERVSGGTHGGTLGAIGAGGAASGSPFASSTAAATRMTPTADFQPPYFPPPFPTTQQQIDFHAAAHLTVAAAAGAGDPYSQLNSIHQQHYQVRILYYFSAC